MQPCENVGMLCTHGFRGASSWKHRCTGSKQPSGKMIDSTQEKFFLTTWDGCELRINCEDGPGKWTCASPAISSLSGSPHRLYSLSGTMKNTSEIEQKSIKNRRNIIKNVKNAVVQIFPTFLQFFNLWKIIQKHSVVVQICPTSFQFFKACSSI